MVEFFIVVFISASSFVYSPGDLKRASDVK
jgi:hypothetical protein